MINSFKKLLQRTSGITQILDRLEILKSIELKLNENYWGLVFNNTITDSRWLHIKSFSPGRWAAGYPFLYILFRVLNDVKPNNILEFGLGESSKMSYQYTKAFPEKNLIVIEQDEKWLNFFSTEKFNVSENVILVDIVSENINGESVYQYKSLLTHLVDKCFDLIIVDGPWGSPKYSRYEVVKLAEAGLLADEFIIIFDDYNTIGERMTIDILRDFFDKNKINYCEGLYSGIKDTLVICSPKFKFITSL